MKQVADLTGQIRGMRSRICQDMWVSDLAGSPADFRCVVRQSFFRPSIGGASLYNTCNETRPTAGALRAARAIQRDALLKTPPRNIEAHKTVRPPPRRSFFFFRHIVASALAGFSVGSLCWLGDFSLGWGAVVMPLEPAQDFVFVEADVPSAGTKAEFVFVP